MSSPFLDDHRFFIVARGGGILAVAAAAAGLPDLGPNQALLAALLACVAAPAAAFVEWLLPSDRNAWSQPVFDTAACVTGSLLAPGVWHPAAAIGALVVGKATARGARPVPWVVLATGSALIAGLGVSAWIHAVTGALPVLVGVGVAIPSVSYYAQRETRRSERVRRDAERAESLALVAGGLGHDFNNILMGISGNAELVACELPDGHPAREALAALVDGAHRASLLSAQLVAFSGGAVGGREPLDLAVEVSSLALLLESALPKGVSIRVDAETGLPPVAGDRAQLQQVLMNLILNAGEAYGSQRGCVEICLRRERDGDGCAWVRCTVADRGRGIAPRDLPSIFEPFFSTKSDRRGLGLASVERVLSDHAGRIEVESELDRGSRFSLVLPGLPLTAVPRPDPPPVESARERRVLVIEDEPEVRRVVERLLSRAGYGVELALDGASGLQLLQQDPKRFDAVLLDLKMPGMDGWECLERLDRVRPLPVLVTSGYDPSGDEIPARRGDAPLAFIGKPYSGRALFAALDGLFARE